MLRNEKYVGHWIWNRSQTRRDPKTGRRRQFPKPESEWFARTDETLRIVPPALWDRVQERLLGARKTWPGGRRRRGFEGQQSGRVAPYPTELLSGGMVCGTCGGAIAKVSGKSGGCLQKQDGTLSVKGERFWPLLRFLSGRPCGSPDSPAETIPSHDFH